MTIDISKVDAVYVQFGISSILFMGSVLTQTPFGYIKFYIVKANTFFLLCLADIDWLSVYLNNIDNSLVMKSIRILVIRRFDHSFLLSKSCLNFFIIQSFDHNLCCLTETELRQLYRCFGYPSTMKLYLLLKWLQYKINKTAFD